MRAAVFLMILSLLTLPVAARKQEVTGSWEFTSSSPLGERTQTIEMKQKGKSLSVSMTTRDGQSVTGKGTVKDGRIEWKLSFGNENAGSFDVTYSGRFEDEGLRGKVRYGRFGSGRWTATRAAAE